MRMMPECFRRLIKQRRALTSRFHIRFARQPNPLKQMKNRIDILLNRLRLQTK